MFDGMFGGFSGSKLKPQLKMAVSRFQIAANKKSSIMKQNMREVALLLAESPPKEEKARIRAEALIRDDNLIEAYEILQLECELLSERIKLMEHSKECPPDLISTVSDLIYACPRVDVPELTGIRKQFRAKYGKKFEEAALTNENGVINERIVSKLSVHPPAAYLVQTYLEKICSLHEVDWSPTIKLSVEQAIEPMAAPVGFSVVPGQGTGLGPDAQAALTGTRDIDEEINYQKPPLPSIPPPAPGFGDGPVVNATPYDPSRGKSGGSGGDDGGGNHLVTVTPIIPGSSPTSTLTQPTTMPSAPVNNSGGKTDSSEYDEVDIFVPQIPSAPPGPGTTNGASNNNANGGDDDDDQKPSASNGGGATSPSASSTYADLAARFEQLKK